MNPWTEAWLADYESPPATAPNPPRKKPIQREHIRQRHIKEWVRDYVAAPHKFMAHDRSAPGGRFTHLRERGRGIQKATPDTELSVAGFPAIWAELKAHGKSPDDDQIRMGRELQALGHHWFWTTTVAGYAAEIARIGVTLRPGWQAGAALHDARADATIARAELKRGDAPKKRAAKPRAEKPTQAQIRRVERIRRPGGVMF